MEHIETLRQLLDTSYSPFHVAENIEELLAENGYEELNERNKWELKRGHKYFTKRNDSSLIAFTLPKEGSHFKIAATHTDSPTFKLKPNPLIKRGNALSLNVEPYGGMIYSTWLDRPLSIAGRVLVKGNNGASSHLFALDKDFCIIPNLAIHMNREINQGFAYNPAIDLLPLIGTSEEDFSFNAFLAQRLNVKTEDILSHDLFLYNRMKSALLGVNDTLLASPRLDDLSSTYSVLFGLLESTNEKEISIYCAFDNEEVGSLTKQGANGTFLKDVLTRIMKRLGNSIEEEAPSSFLLSVDNAHATHPNHPEMSDSTSLVNLNKGIVIKYNANQLYTSDAYSSGLIKTICNIHSIPYQEFTNRSDKRGGSTLGNLSNSEVSLNAADIGIAQLAMHSSYEVMGSEDVERMVDLTRYYYSSYIQYSDTGFQIID